MLFGEVTNLMVSMKFRQLLLREKFDESQVTWENLDRSDKGNKIRSYMLRFLRTAALMRYIMEYPKIKSQRILL